MAPPGNQYVRPKTRTTVDFAAAFRVLLLREALGIALLAVAGFLLLSLTSYHPQDPSFNHIGGSTVSNLAGRTGAYLADGMLQLLGMASFWPPVLLGATGIRLMQNRPMAWEWDRLLAAPVLILVTALWCGIVLPARGSWFPSGPGGLFGTLFGAIMTKSFGSFGSLLLTVALLLLSLMVVVRFSMMAVVAATMGHWQRFRHGITVAVAVLGALGPRLAGLLIPRAAPDPPSASPGISDLEAPAGEGRDRLSWEEPRLDFTEEPDPDTLLPPSRWQRWRETLGGWGRAVAETLLPGPQVAASDHLPGEQEEPDFAPFDPEVIQNLSADEEVWSEVVAQRQEELPVQELPAAKPAPISSDWASAVEPTWSEPASPSVATVARSPVLAKPAPLLPDAADRGGSAASPAKPVPGYGQKAATVAPGGDAHAARTVIPTDSGRLSPSLTRPDLTGAVGVAPADARWHRRAEGGHAAARSVEREPTWEGGGAVADREPVLGESPSRRSSVTAVAREPFFQSDGDAFVVRSPVPDEPRLEGDWVDATATSPDWGLADLERDEESQGTVGIDLTADRSEWGQEEEGEPDLGGSQSFGGQEEGRSLTGELPREPDWGPAPLSARERTPPNPVVLRSEPDLEPDREAEREGGEELDLDERDRPELPSMDLLVVAPEGERIDPAFLESQSRLIERKLADFAIKGRIIAAHPGPVVTTFEFDPAPGLKASKVIGIAEDLARSISAASVRVVGNIPGKSVIGIEVANAKRQTVYLRSILESEACQRATSPLTVAMGASITGHPVVADLAKMPHLLVAGTTGSGKSVAVNAMICSILFRATPAEVRFLMVDPKMLELSIYQGIPHLLAPVVTEVRKAATLLKWAVSEMEERYRAMSEMGVRNLSSYNARLAEYRQRGDRLTRRVKAGFDPQTGVPIERDEELSLEAKPLIVIIIDELADLMMQVGKDVEPAVARLAQMARAAGLHLILATQRPSVDVITGLIKANFPTRLSFMVSSRIDSRTILDTQGAELLLGMGDGLYLGSGTSRLMRIHAPFLSDQEVNDVVAYLRQTGKPQFDPRILAFRDDADGEDGDGGDAEDENDEYYEHAVALVLKSRKVSASMIQRHFKMGYNRASRIVERMAREGYVTEANAAGKREVNQSFPSPSEPVAKPRPQA